MIYSTEYARINIAETAEDGNNTENRLLCYYNPFLYCSEYFDAETEMYYLRARYYNPANGRFTQQDAWAFMDPADPLTLNLYTYCANNPVMYVDPSGNDMIILVNEDFKYSLGGVDIPLGHMGALVQDSAGQWYYFSFGSDYLVLKEVDNYGKKKDYSLADLSDDVAYAGGTAEYTASVYIAGDFSETYNYFASLGTPYKNKEFKYNFVFNNCGQVVIRGMKKGTLGDGTSAEDYLSKMSPLNDLVPLVSLRDLKLFFYNDAFHKDDYHKSINDQLWESQYGVWYHRNQFATSNLKSLNY